MKPIIWALATVAVVVVITMSGSVSAHFTSLSPYTYWRDVRPILDERCGRCHGDRDVSGLSLMNYQSTRGATWLIRQRLIRGHMPPWFAEGPFKSPPPVTARELNVLMTWATGGAPEGPLVPRPSHATASWPLGLPDLMLPLPAYTAAKDQDDQIREVTLPSAKIAGRVIRAVDLTPGTPALVRSAEIVARSGAREQVLALWQPGELPSSLSVDAGFHIPAGARLIARIRYRRWFGAPASDRSQLGVYFAPRGTDRIDSIELSADPSRVATQIIRQPARLLALRPIAGPSGAVARIILAGSNGSTQELGRIEMQRDWARRYVFAAPVLLQAGNKIELSVIPSQSTLWNSLTAEPLDNSATVRVALEFVK